MKNTMKPLYPQMCGSENCVRLPLFGPPCSCRCGCDGTQVVQVENPCCPGECAEVALSVDSCGNLVICVRRPQPMPCRRC